MPKDGLSAVITRDTDSRDEAEGPLLPEEEAHSDMASFQPTDSDVPSFLEDCNRVTKPFFFFIWFKAADQLLVSPQITSSIIHVRRFTSGLWLATVFLCVTLLFFVLFEVGFSFLWGILINILCLANVTSAIFFLSHDFCSLGCSPHRPNYLVVSTRFGLIWRTLIMCLFWCHSSLTAPPTVGLLYASPWLFEWRWSHLILYILLTHRVWRVKCIPLWPVLNQPVDLSSLFWMYSVLSLY